MSVKEARWEYQRCIDAYLAAHWQHREHYVKTPVERCYGCALNTTVARLPPASHSIWQSLRRTRRRRSPSTLRPRVAVT